MGSLPQNIPSQGCILNQLTGGNVLSIESSCFLNKPERDTTKYAPNAMSRTGKTMLLNDEKIISKNVPKMINMITPTFITRKPACFWFTSSPYQPIRYMPTPTNVMINVQK